VHDVAETCQAVAVWQAAGAMASPAEDFDAPADNTGSALI